MNFLPTPLTSIKKFFEKQFQGKQKIQRDQSKSLELRKKLECNNFLLYIFNISKPLFVLRVICHLFSFYRNVFFISSYDYFRIWQHSFYTLFSTDLTRSRKLVLTSILINSEGNHNQQWKIKWSLLKINPVQKIILWHWLRLSTTGTNYLRLE